MRSIHGFLMAPKLYAKKLVYLQWGSGAEYTCLVHLWQRESNWNYKSASKSSTAYGIPQFLNETWVHYHYPVRPKDPYIQINAGLRYITKRYNTPCRAWYFWKHNLAKGNAWY